MKRVLSFDGVKAEKRFELLRTALLAGGDGKQPRNREIIRSEARLLNALDEVSIEAQDSVDKDKRVLKANAPVLLSQEDFALLSTYVDTTPWAPRVSREVVDLQDWLSAADKVD